MKRNLADDELKIEAYRSLQNENSAEARDTMTLDVIFVASSAAWFFKSPTSLTVLPPLVWQTLYLIVALLWFFLGFRTHCRKNERIRLMISIEKCLGFNAYRAMAPYESQKRWWLVRYPFYRGVVLFAILLVILFDLLEC